MANTVYGKKYNRDLSTPQIAAAFRVDVKDAIKAGVLPAGLKLSVKSSRFAGGSSIRVTIKACPSVTILNVENVNADRADGGTYPSRPRYTAEAIALRDALDGMLKAYNYDGSDTMTDYFHVNFYDNVDFCGELEAADYRRAEMLSDRGTELEAGLEMLARGMVAIATMGPK
jgi:hypothetical protein